jgi:hypothetical protein
MWLSNATHVFEQSPEKIGTLVDYVDGLDIGSMIVWGVYTLFLLFITNKEILEPGIS